MKKLLLILSVAFAPAAFATIDTTDYSCQEVRDMVRNSRTLTMSFGGTETLSIKTNFTGESCGFSDAREIQVFAPTTDYKRCNVGFFCDNTDSLAFEYPGSLLIIE